MRLLIVYFFSWVRWWRLWLFYCVNVLNSKLKFEEILHTRPPIESLWLGVGRFNSPNEVSTNFKIYISLELNLRPREVKSYSDMHRCWNKVINKIFHTKSQTLKDLWWFCRITCFCLPCIEIFEMELKSEAPQTLLFTVSTPVQSSIQENLLCSCWTLLGTNTFGCHSMSFLIKIIQIKAWSQRDFTENAPTIVNLFLNSREVCLEKFQDNFVTFIMFPVY